MGWSESCYFRCAEEVTCQSYNFVIGQNVCELNNRTKEARPEDFKPDHTRFYVKRVKNRGTRQSSSFVRISNFQRIRFECYSLAHIDDRISSREISVFYSVVICI